MSGGLVCTGLTLGARLAGGYARAMDTGPQAPFDAGYQIHSCHPPQGDWFQVEVYSEDGGVTKRVTVHRVLLWALVSAAREIQRIEAITDRGTPPAAMGESHNSLCEYHHVRGCDRAPNGRTWDEVYAGVTPKSVGIYELTDEQVEALGL